MEPGTQSHDMVSTPTREKPAASSLSCTSLAQCGPLQLSLLRFLFVGFGFFGLTHLYASGLLKS